MTHPIRLIFHIGAGKTGTSSIQHTFLRNHAALRAQGIGYLGLMLEHADRVAYPWQAASGSELFHALPREQAEAQLSEVLAGCVAQAQASGLHTLVWSNESFFDRNQAARGPLLKLMADGLDVQWVAYVRRHDAWIRSAYVQWAIKHKTNTGPVMPFSDWVQRRPARFAPALLDLLKAFPGRLSIRNFDAAHDAVGDFCSLLPVDMGHLPVVRDNASPSNEETLLRALFNTRVREKILPVRFDRLVARHTQFGSSPTAYLAALMPNASDLAAVREQATNDRLALDDLLLAQGQPTVDTSERVVQPVEVNTESLLMALAHLVMHQAQRIERLEAAMRQAGTLPPADSKGA